MFLLIRNRKLSCAQDFAEANMMNKPLMKYVVEMQKFICEMQSKPEKS
jgi:hypothetical protein